MNKNEDKWELLKITLKGIKDEIDKEVVKAEEPANKYLLQMTSETYTTIFLLMNVIENQVGGE